MSSQHGRLRKEEAKPEDERLLPLDAVIELEGPAVMGGNLGAKR